MVIKCTKHYKQRIKERFNKDSSYMLETFKFICKKIKRNKLFPKKWNTENTYEVYYKGLTYIYAKSQWEFILITSY